MRPALLLFVCLVTFHTGCSDRASERVAGNQANADPMAAAAGTAVCRVLDPEIRTELWGWKKLVCDVECPGPGKVELLFGDRVGEPSKTAPCPADHHHVTSTTDAGMVRIEFSFQFLTGRDVLTRYVKPVGGEEALAALRRAVPGIDESRLGEFRMLNASVNGRGYGGGPLPGKSVPPAGANTAIVRVPVGAEVLLPPGEHVILWRCAWNRGIGTNTEGVIGPELPPLLVEGEAVPLEEYPLPVWTLRARFVPWSDGQSSGR